MTKYYSIHWKSVVDGKWHVKMVTGGKQVINELHLLWSANVPAYYTPFSYRTEKPIAAVGAMTQLEWKRVPRKGKMSTKGRTSNWRI